MATYNGSLVDWVLQTIDENWQTGNYDPKPTLIDRADNDPVNVDWGPSKVMHDLQDSNAVGAGSGERLTEISGWEYDEDVDAVIPVRVEGYSGSYGHIDNHADFQALYREMERCLKVERQWPIRPDPQRDDEWYKTIEFRNQADTSDSWQEYWRYDVDVVFLGHENLPGTP